MVEAGDRRGPLTQLRRGVLEYCVLSLLARERLYGFDIVRKLSEVEQLVTTEGTIYPLLSRLRRDGWVQTTWAESAEGPPRRYYTITAAGKHALAGFIDDWAGFRDSVDHLLTGGIR